MSRCLVLYNCFVACITHVQIANDDTDVSGQEQMRGLIMQSSMSQARAKCIVAQLDDAIPWSSVGEYVEAVAALSALYPDEMQRKTYVGGKKICQILWCATAAERVHWFFNNIRARRRVEPRMLSLLGSGTSPNEALHSEINRWFKNQPEIYAPTLELQLRVGQMAKLMCHNAAMYRPTLRQFSHQTVLNLVANSIVFDQDEWLRSCSELAVKDGVLAMATPVLVQQRVQIHHRIQDWTMKRPAACKRPAAFKRPAANIKRHPFNLKRARTYGHF